MDLANLEWDEVKNLAKRESRRQNFVQITLEIMRKNQEWEQKYNLEESGYTIENFITEYEKRLTFYSRISILSVTVYIYMAQF